eukprot:379010-Pyramimonas_sp.AAC.1
MPPTPRAYWERIQFTPTTWGFAQTNREFTPTPRGFTRIRAHAIYVISHPRHAYATWIHARTHHLI